MTVQFHVDEKVVIWERVTLTIDAETKAEAYRLAKQYFDGQEDVDEEKVDIGVTVCMYDTSEPLAPAQNNDMPTRELIVLADDARYDRTIRTNLKGPSRRRRIYLDRLAAGERETESFQQALRDI